MGLLSNIVVIPLTFVIVLCGWVSLLIPPLASFYNQAAYYQIDGIDVFSSANGADCSSVAVGEFTYLSITASLVGKCSGYLFISRGSNDLCRRGIWSGYCALTLHALKAVLIEFGSLLTLHQYVQHHALLLKRFGVVFL